MDCKKKNDEWNTKQERAKIYDDNVNVKTMVTGLKVSQGPYIIQKEDKHRLTLDLDKCKPAVISRVIP